MTERSQMKEGPRNLFPEVDSARFNVAVWQRSSDERMVTVSREVDRPGEKGEPDKGRLVLSEFNKQGDVVHERVIWKPERGGLLLEDPRAVVLPGGRVHIGLTAVLHSDVGEYFPYPALVRIHSHETWSRELPPISLIQSFGPGKNLTPIDDSLYFFRPDSSDYNHKLMVFSYNEGQSPQKQYDVRFPEDLEWAKWRIGTTMPPIWMGEDQGLLPIHGISIIYNKFVYSLGRARLYKKDGRFAVEVADDPILTPDDFVEDNGSSMVEELHPHMRRVVYACGGLVKPDDPDNLYLYVNVGDRATFEVGFDIEQLKSGLFY